MMLRFDEKMSRSCSRSAVPVLEQLVAGMVEAVFRALGSEQLRERGVPRPVDQRPFAQRFDEAVRHQQLRGGDLARVHAQAREHRCETERLPVRTGT